MNVCAAISPPDAFLRLNSRMFEASEPRRDAIGVVRVLGDSTGEGDTFRHEVCLLRLFLLVCAEFPQALGCFQLSLSFGRR